MIDRAHGFHFAMEPRSRLGRSLPVGRQQFDSSRPFEFGMECFVYGPHAALAQLFDKRVLADLQGQNYVWGMIAGIWPDSDPDELIDPILERSSSSRESSELASPGLARRRQARTESLTPSSESNCD